MYGQSSFQASSASSASLRADGFLPVFGQEIPKSSVVDLTGKRAADGTLGWTPPVGHWVVLRIGHSLLGITNHPATKEATGLEADKLNATYVKHYMDAYLNSYKETVGTKFDGKPRHHARDYGQLGGGRPELDR